MLKYRLLTAALGVPAVVYLIFWSPSVLFNLFLSVFSAISAWECFLLLGAGFKKLDWGYDPRPQFGVLVSVVTALGVFVSGWGTEDHDLLTGVLGLYFLSSIGAVLVFERGIEQRIAALCCLTFSFFYAFIPWTCLVQARSLPPGGAGILFLLAVVWLGDTGGYFGGLKFGKKLFPKFSYSPVLSSSKTLEGSLSGILLSVGAGLVVAAIFPWYFRPLWATVLFSLLLNVLGQAGDLFESSLKRFAGVKDSGHIIPGHGGFLDRTDGVLLAAPFFYLWIWLFNY